MGNIAATNPNVRRKLPVFIAFHRNRLFVGRRESVCDWSGHPPCMAEIDFKR
jgi:hypothetical protein